MNFKNEYAKKEKEIERIREEAEKELSRAVRAKNNQEELIKERVDEKYTELKKSLENKVDGEILAIKGIFIGSILYGVVCTLFTGMHSERFVIDFKEFFTGIKVYLLFCTEKLLEMANMASQIGKMIPEAVSSFIVRWIVWLVVLAALIIGSIALIFFITKTAIKTYKKICEEYKDLNKINLAIMLFILASSVYFAEQIRAIIPFNLVCLILLSPIFFWTAFVIIGITIALIKDLSE